MGRYGVQLRAGKNFVLTICSSWGTARGPGGMWAAAYPCQGVLG
jgi:hypothetical protein